MERDGVDEKVKAEFLLCSAKAFRGFGTAKETRGVKADFVEKPLVSWAFKAIVARTVAAKEYFMVLKVPSGTIRIDFFV